MVLYIHNKLTKRIIDTYKEGRGGGHMKHKVKIIIALLVLLLTHSAVAEWYIGAETIENRAIPTLDSLSGDSFSEKSYIEDKGLSLTGGYRSSQYFSVQLEYQDEMSFGLDDMFTGSSLWFPETNVTNFESNALFLSGISSYPINDQGALYMKGGIYNWEVESDLFETGNSLLPTTQGTDIFYGLGANYDLNARFGVSAEWERYELDESEVDFLSTELKFKF